MAYVPLGKPRFNIVQLQAGDLLVIPAQRNMLLVLFLGVWLGAWTIGGMTAIAQLLLHFQAFIALWIVGWAIGWGLVAAILSWLLTGKELVRVTDGDLEVGFAILGLTRKRLYRGADIRNLAAMPGAGIWQARQMPAMPVLGQSRGSVQFSYGARTESFGFGLDSTEAAAVVAWVQKMLPQAPG